MVTRLSDTKSSVSPSVRRNSNKLDSYKAEENLNDRVEFKAGLTVRHEDLEELVLGIIEQAFSGLNLDPLREKEIAGQVISVLKERGWTLDKVKSLNGLR
ncbi:hypothetical protein [Ketobacter alkanivorans]|uniref:Uncharacterized protein n=1 Tax=Ketobacter alkanivorans TaxID=1917421 RepID=A0A2K9LKU3_9GAMM|nr:hypothetical protein [Ketobacter alkanivorans]AUM12948.1 hypothetical protein Kalk_11160 [Ketobacter alkanivorans]